MCRVWQLCTFWMWRYILRKEKKNTKNANQVITENKKNIIWCLTASFWLLRVLEKILLYIMFCVLKVSTQSLCCLCFSVFFPSLGQLSGFSLCVLVLKCIIMFGVLIYPCIRNFSWGQKLCWVVGFQTTVFLPMLQLRMRCIAIHKIAGRIRGVLAFFHY